MPRSAELASSVVMLVFGLVLVIFLIPEQISLPDFQATMSPRLLPYLCGGAIVLLSAISILRSIFVPSEESRRSLAVWFPRAELKALIAVPAIFAVSIALFSLVSSAVACIALIIGLLALLGERNPLAYAALPAGMLLTGYFIFRVLLGTAIG